MKVAFYAFLLLVLGACNEPKAVPNCGCDGPVYEIVTDVLGIYLDNGLLVTLSPAKQYTGTYTLACNPDFAKGNVTNRDTVILSGLTHLPCYTAADPLIEQPGMIKLTAIRRK